jgi:hypothetical protein
MTHPNAIHPCGIESPKVGAAAGLRPEPVPAPSAVVRGFDPDFTMRTGKVVHFDDPSVPRPGLRGFRRARHEYFSSFSAELSGSCPRAFGSGRAVEETGIALPERERIRLGAGLGERDLQRPLADRVVLAHELVHAAVLEHAVAVLVDVDAV